MAPTSEQRKSASPTRGPPRDLAYMRAFGTDEWMDEVPPEKMSGFILLDAKILGEWAEIVIDNFFTDHNIHHFHF